MDRRKYRGTMLLSFPLLVLGCNSEASNSGTGDESCLAQQSKACTCPDGSESVSVCAANGTYAPCQCDDQGNAATGGIGGAVATGGTPGTGGDPGAGGVPGTGGMPGTGGDPGTGGAPGTGGMPVAGAGGMAGVGGAPAPATCNDPNTIRDFTFTDINPNSQTFNKQRSLNEACGKVLIIETTLFS